MSDEERDVLLEELLADRNKEERSEFVLPNEEAIPEQYRGKPLSVVLADLDRSVKEREELSKALENSRSAPTPEPPKETAPPPPTSAGFNYEVIVDELTNQKVQQRLVDTPVLQPYKQEIMAMLKNLPADSRMLDSTIDSVVTYIRGYHFNEIVSKHAPSQPVVTDAQAGPPKRDEPAISLTEFQAANLRSYYGTDTVGLKQFVDSLKGVE